MKNSKKEIDFEKQYWRLVTFLSSGMLLIIYGATSEWILMIQVGFTLIAAGLAWTLWNVKSIGNDL